ncbi:MAG: DUF6249 domain-containing protein [Planctomycetota bacterium]|jgi:hypothetical protein
MFGFWNTISDGIRVLLIFLGMSAPMIVVGAIYYLKKRLEHKQILAAIEKGVSPSEIRPPKPAYVGWIKSLTAGIALLIIAAGLTVVIFVNPKQSCGCGGSDGLLIIVIILFGLGVSCIIRGLLKRKAEKKLKADS